MLQGVLDETVQPPMFELTDPVIHNVSKKGRRNVYGRTDKGREGVDCFFETHRCNGICQRLGIANSIDQ